MSRAGGARLARTVALAVLIGIGLFNLYQAAAHWTLSDAAAYWNAAIRLRDGLALYPAVPDVDASEVYRYAPWFAWVTVPVSFLPVQLAGALWSVALLVASGVALIPLVRARAWVLVILFAPILIGISAIGNVQPLIVAGLVSSVERRSGPVWIGLAASLKLFPILFAAVYVGRREWTRASASVAVGAVLWAPAFLTGMGHYPIEAGRAASIYAVPVLYAALAALAVGATLVLARSRYGWVAAAATVILALPRLFVYDVTFLMVGLARKAEGEGIS